MDRNTLIIIVAVVFIAAVMGFGIWRAIGQRRKMEQFASAKGWRFEKQDGQLLRDYPDIFPFGVGETAACHNVLHLEWGGRPGHSFDYSYVEKSGSGDNESSTTKRFHVVGLRLPHPLPRLTLRRRRKLDAIEAALTKPIQFESTQFNGQWFVEGEHPRAAHDIIDPRMMEWLLTCGDKSNFVIEDGLVLTFRSGRQKTESIEPMLGDLTQFIEQVPAHVWQKAQGEYPRPTRHRRTLDLGDVLRTARGGGPRGA